MFSMPTSGPLSPTVSLERKKLEQAGVPPGQEQQGAAAKGMPISGDLAQLIQLNRMLQQKGAMQQQANPAPSTVAQDLMQQVMQQQAPQMQRAPQMQPQPDPRQQGIANLPQEAVGNGMAAGGIVAFDDGGSVRHFDAGGLTAAELEEFNKLRNLQFTGYDPHSLTNEAGISTSSDVSAAQDQTAKRYRELLVRKYAADQAAEQAAKEQAQAAKVSGVLSQYGLDAPPAPPAPAAGGFTPSAGPVDGRTYRPSAPRISDEIREAAARVGAPQRAPAGLAELVPTLTGGKRASDLDTFGMQAKIDANRSSDSYAAQRKKMEDAAGLTSFFDRQRDEYNRLKEESSPEAQKRAFLNNLSMQLAGQIGQRGVPLSSRLAQMVGAYGSTKASTSEEFRKRNADLNKASLDLQEKQAMYRMTGSMQDRAEAEKAQTRYEGFLKDKETLSQRAQEAKDRATEAGATAANNAAKLKQGDRELTMNEARYKAQAEHEKIMQEITSGNAPQVKINSLLTSYSQQLKDITSLLKTPLDLSPDEKTRLTEEYKDVVARLNDVREVVRKGVGMNAAPAPASVGAPTVKWGALK